jgi:hypothetical protein
MKRIIQITIVLILAIALIVGLFQIGTGGEPSQAANSCRVGWNTRTPNCLALVPGSWTPAKPNVGWNS